MKKKTKRGFVRFSTSQCSMSRHKKSFSWRSTEENSAKPTVCNPCPTAGRHGVTHTTQKPTTYVYIYGGKRVYVPGREQKSRVVNGGETTPPLVHPTALWTRPVDTPLEKSRLRGRAWPPEVNRWKTIENVIRDNQLSTYWPRLSFSRSFLSRSLKLKLIHRKKATSLTIGQSSLQSSGLFIKIIDQNVLIKELSEISMNGKLTNFIVWFSFHRRCRWLGRLILLFAAFLLLIVRTLTPSWQYDIDMYVQFH